MPSRYQSAVPFNRSVYEDGDSLLLRRPDDRIDQRDDDDDVDVFDVDPYRQTALGLSGVRRYEPMAKRGPGIPHPTPVTPMVRPREYLTF